MCNGAEDEDVEDELASRARGVDLLLRTDQIDLTGAEPVDDLEQLLERAAEAIQTNDTQAVAGTGVIEQLVQAETVKRTTGDDILENTDGAGRFQSLMLSASVLLAGGDPGVAELSPLRAIACVSLSSHTGTGTAHALPPASCLG